MDKDVAFHGFVISLSFNVFMLHGGCEFFPMMYVLQFQKVAHGPNWKPAEIISNGNI